MDISGATYQILNSSLSVVESNSSSATTFNWMMSQCSSGFSVYVDAGTYTVDASWGDGSVLTSTNGVSNLTITFASGAILNESNGVNNPVLMIYGCSNVVVNGGTFNGNGQNQSPGSGNLQSPQGIVIINCQNCLVTNAIIYNARVFGVTIGADGAETPPFSNNGVSNCQIYCTYAAGSAYTGWNGIQLGGTNSGGTVYDANDYAVNNSIYNWSDVGVSLMSQNAVVTGNTIYDMYGENQDTGNGGAYWGGSYHGAQEGIVVEGIGGSGSGNYALIAENSIYNCGTSSPNSPGSGIGVASGTGSSYIIISGNTLNNCTIGGTAGNGAIYLSESATYCQITFNSISNSHDGIDIASGCNNNNVYGNTYPTGVTTDYTNGGSGNTASAPSIVSLTNTSSPILSGAISVTGVINNVSQSSYVLPYLPYTFYASVSASITLVANNVSTFTSWSDSGAQTHVITVPSSDTIYTAYFTGGGGSNLTKLFNINVSAINKFENVAYSTIKRIFGVSV